MFKNKTGLAPSTFTAVALAGATFATPALADDHTKVGGKIYASYGYDLTDTPYAGYQDGDPRPNGFEVDRVYLDFKKKIDKTFSIRATTDVGRSDSGKLELFLKYAYMQVNLAEDIKVRIGAAPNAQISMSDKFWGGRWLAKSFTDQEGAVDSADIGVHALGKHADGMFKWGAAIVNGEGYGNPDLDNDKTFQARATVDPLNGDIKLPISVYVSQEFYTPEDVDGQNIIIASVGLDQEFVSVWGEYVMDTPGTKFVDEAGSEEDVKAGGMSVNVVGKVPDLLNVVARYDKWDPNTEVDDDGHSTIRVGVTKNLAKKVDVGLMYETTNYEAPSAHVEGENKQSDKAVFLRLQAGF